MSAENDLSPVLKKLRLSGVLESLDLRIRQAVDDDIDHAEFLYRILHDEVERRDAKQLCQRMRRAKFDSNKEVEDFDFRFNPDVPKAKIIDLATCAFVEKNENVCLLGKAGVGKSHLAQAIGQRAVRAGHSVVYVRANTLIARGVDGREKTARFWAAAPLGLSLGERGAEQVPPAPGTASSEWR